MYKKVKLLLLLLTTVVSFSQNKIQIKKTYDKFDKSTTYRGEVGSMGVYYNNTSHRPFLTVTVYDTYLTYASGVKILFEDGEVMQFTTNDELGSYSGGTYMYYFLISPTNEEWIKLSEKRIIGVKVHIFERFYKKGSDFNLLVEELNKIFPIWE